VNMGNPHAVAFVDDLAHAGNLFAPPPFTPASAYPDGVNVEFVVDRGRTTSPCASRARRRRDPLVRHGRVRRGRRHRPPGRRRPRRDRAPATYTVDVLGGRLVITERPDGEIEMTGPAVIVAEGEFDTDWLDAAQR